MWVAADKLRGHMVAAEYKHVVLALIFLKYISDAFEEKHQTLLDATADPDSDYYVSDEASRSHQRMLRCTTPASTVSGT